MNLNDDFTLDFWQEVFIGFPSPLHELIFLVYQIEDQSSSEL